MTYQTEVMADSPVGYWKMDGTAGTDSSSAGTRTLTPTAIVDGMKSPVKDQAVTGAGWHFNGSASGSFSMPTITTAFSFETWFKTTAPNTKSAHTLWRADGASVGVVRLQGSGNAAFPGQVYGVIGSAEFNTVTTYNDNAWHHLVVTAQGTAVKVYVDKVLKNNLATGSASYTFNATGYLGRDVANTASEYLIGSMDEVAIYTTALSQTRVNAHYDAAQVALSTGAGPFRGWGVPL